jgi:hypothetical protein
MEQAIHAVKARHGAAARERLLSHLNVLQSGLPTPLVQLWFGNFFEPWLSSRERVGAALDEIRDLGFNAINLDSKAWADFFARYRGEPASQYVGMQEFMMSEAHRRGLGHSFLAVYLCGDNLYPALRDAPPVRGADAIGPDGQSLDTYLYGSEKAQASMLEHVAGLMRLYGEGHVRFAGREPSLPIHTMFDPIVKPSFDPEGRRQYLAWLERRYNGDIDALSRRYQLTDKPEAANLKRQALPGAATKDISSSSAFADLAPTDYWLKPDELTHSTCGYPSEADFAGRSPALWRWIDNQTWLAEETERFFATMKVKYRALDPRLFLFPVLAQWGMFFPPAGNRWWDTATRAIDPYRIAPHVDATVFIAAPINPENDPDAHALSAELSIMRNANAGRPWIAGLFMGRHAHGDLYRFVSPAEVIGTAALHGAAGLHVYGYGGADDGGVLQHMGAPFKASLRTGNQWAARVLPKVAGLARLKEAAILFPRATQLFEPMLLEQGRKHRLDLLGWYRQLADLGFNVDILHPDQVKEGVAADYRVLVVPTDACYEFAPDPDLERALAGWVKAGGLCVHGAGSPLVRAALGLREDASEFDCITVGNGLLTPQGWAFATFPDAEPLALFHRRGGIAIGRTRLGRGHVLSVGFPYGYAYATRTPACPFGYNREEAHGVQLLDDHPVVQELGALRALRWRGGRGIETGWFDGAVVAVNHCTMPVDLSALLAEGGAADWQVEAGGRWLIPHSAIHVQFKKRSP